MPVLADASNNPVFFAATGEFTGTVSGVQRRSKTKTKGNRYKRYWSYTPSYIQRPAASLVSGAARNRANGLSRARMIANLAVTTRQ